MNGYAIRRKITVSTSNFYNASFGSIYPALNRLGKKGWIIPQEQDSRRKKIEYSIGESGKKAFLDWLCQPIKPSAVNHEYLLRLFFYRHLPKNIVENLIGDFILEIRTKIRELDKIEAIVKANADEFEMASLDYGRQYYQFIVKWYSGFLNSVTLM